MNCPSAGRTPRCPVGDKDQCFNPNHQIQASLLETVSEQPHGAHDAERIFQPSRMRTDYANREGAVAAGMVPTILSSESVELMKEPLEGVDALAGTGMA